MFVTKSRQSAFGLAVGLMVGLTLVAYGVMSMSVIGICGSKAGPAAGRGTRVLVSAQGIRDHCQVKVRTMVFSGLAGSVAPTHFILKI